MNNQPLCLGLDIGTTTISCVVVDPSGGALVDRRTVKSGADIPSSSPLEKMQDVSVIEGHVTALTRELLTLHPGIRSIGLTGQMHGILYLDKQGSPLSPLYTWQDERSRDLCPRLHETTGWQLSPGYGLATHAALLDAGQVPEKAFKICTIMDYLAFVLCGRENLRIHSSNAAGLGFFDVQRGSFDGSALKKVGIDPSILPPVTGNCELAGHHGEIPVAVAIGDNQASFLGSVADPQTAALANFGTGSQISVQSDTPSSPEKTIIEMRPFLGQSCLVCGSALCGGRAYALLEGFFREYAKACGLPDTDQYALMNRLALESLSEPDPMTVDTRFCGTRTDPSVRGSAVNIGQHNFTPGGLIAGTLRGMARELHQMFALMPSGKIDHLVASGNAIRKNPALKTALAQVFGMEVSVPAHEEEAAFGCALFGAAAAGLSDMGSLRKNCIRYQ